MRVEIEYCVPCGYLDKAVDAQKTILSALGQNLDGVTLKPGDKGVFTFRADGDVVYTKPEEFDIDAIVEKLKTRV